MVESNYCRRGSGTPLVLLHSLGQRWPIWLPVLDRLSERHDVLAVDLPRLGRAPIPHTVTDEGIKAFGVRSLERVFKHLGVERPHVAGLGLGGMLAVAAAAAGTVSSATALSPTGFWTPAQRRATVAQLRAFRMASRLALATRPPLAASRLVQTTIMSRLCSHPSRIGSAESLELMAAMRDATAFEEAMRSTRLFRWRPGRQPEVPVTMAWADRDKMISRHQANGAVQVLPGALQVRLPRCGHLCMSDDPELVANVILSTCARAERGRPAVSPPS
ncbi:alpha/beta fold hydrolase [Pseudonocardia eucalypti]|uniref:Alpha/beta fold hydrolase n=1 Tax=Pseudonocardia eucalypti TaxID=648755 RepID=A0ABP9QML6_9PSEU|nr:pimeloyl-ACP methyl ester carboxylesterase [Pseudonocardia eucalypti]